MKAIEIFEKVTLIAPMEQRRFFNYLNDTIRELMTMFTDCLFVDKEKDFTPLGKLSDEIPVFPLYCNAIVDNILYLSGQDATYKSEFLRKADNAHRHYWNKKAKGRIIKRLRW